MSGVFKLGGKTVATHDESTDVVSLASDVDISNLDISNNDFSNVDMSNVDMSNVNMSNVNMSNMTFPAGHVLQVEQAVKTDQWSTTNTTGVFPQWVDITGLSVQLTPKGDNSRFLIQSVVYASSNYWKSYLNLQRVIQSGTTDLYLGDVNGNRPRTTNVVLENSFQNTHGAQGLMTQLLIDSPNIPKDQQVTYKLQGAARKQGTSSVMYVNRSVPHRDVGNEYDSVTASSIIVMEIAA